MNFFGTEFLPSIPNEYLVVGLLGLVIALVIINRKRWFGKVEKYKEIILSKEIEKEIKDLLEVSGNKIFRERRNLRSGFNVIGRITRAVEFNWNLETDEAKNPKPVIKTTEQKDAEELRNEIAKEDPPNNFFLFEVMKNDIIGKIKFIFNKGMKYFLVDRQFIDESPLEYIINPSAQHIRYFGEVYIFSTMGKNIIMNLADKMTLQQVLQEQVNFVPRMTFLEVKTARFSQRARELASIEQNKYESRVENLDKESD
jgi:hypothetical protein